MKFCINCKHYQETRGSKYARCTRDWHDLVTGEPLDFDNGLGGKKYPHCEDLRVTAYKNPTAPAYCGPSAAGFEHKEPEKVDICPRCKGAGFLHALGAIHLGQCRQCDGIGLV